LWQAERLHYSVNTPQTAREHNKKRIHPEPFAYAVMAGQNKRFQYRFISHQKSLIHGLRRVHIQAAETRMSPKINV
jgi:hypothetical protein